VTFSKPTTARRTVAVLERKTLGHQSVTLTVCPPPTSASAGVIEKRWTDEEMVEQAQRMIIDELRALLAKDINDRIVMPELRRVMLEERSNRTQALMEQKPLEKRGLKGLSFKKAKPKEVIQEAVVVKEDVKEEADEQEVEERPKKKRKKDVKKVAKKVVEELEVESEEEDEADTVRIEEVRRKRVTSEVRDEEAEEQPMRKKQKKEVTVAIKGKKALKKKFMQKKEIVDDVVQPADFDVPAVEDVQITVAFDSSLSPSRSPSPLPVSKRRPRLPTPQPTPPPDPVGLGLCEDDEDIFFVKLALSGYKPPIVDVPVPPPPSATAVPFRKHVTGSARTEGFYKITHAEKAAYVAQYQARTNTNQVELPGPAEDPQSQHVTSSRSNRANARRRAQGLEEINQVQRAVALSKGESAANELTFKFNQLQTRKKHLRFARSPIHDWGLYAMEKISKGEMVIEYVGEVIRAQVAEKREKTYERQGIGSSYLFRIDEDLVVDATKKGNLGYVGFLSLCSSFFLINDFGSRLINHSCDPNCTAKIITISGEKKIVIYAKQEIELGDEITYGAFPLTS
jgi:histone-lysine N-methyltransferase SETD1